MKIFLCILVAATCLLILIVLLKKPNTGLIKFLTFIIMLTICLVMINNIIPIMDKIESYPAAKEMMEKAKEGRAELNKLEKSGIYSEEMLDMLKKTFEPLWKAAEDAPKILVKEIYKDITLCLFEIIITVSILVLFLGKKHDKIEVKEMLDKKQFDQKRANCYKCILYNREEDTCVIRGHDLIDSELPCVSFSKR